MSPQAVILFRVKGEFSYQFKTTDTIIYIYKYNFTFLSVRLEDTKHNLLITSIRLF